MALPSLLPRSSCSPPPCRGSPFSSWGSSEAACPLKRLPSPQQTEPRALPGIQASCLRKATQRPTAGSPRLSKRQQDRHRCGNAHSHPSNCSSPNLRAPLSVYIRTDHSTPLRCPQGEASHCRLSTGQHGGYHQKLNQLLSLSRLQPSVWPPTQSEG